MTRLFDEVPQELRAELEDQLLGAALNVGQPLKERLNTVAESIISLEVLRAGGNLTRAARRLKVSRWTVHRRLKDLGPNQLSRNPRVEPALPRVLVVDDDARVRTDAVCRFRDRLAVSAVATSGAVSALECDDYSLVLCDLTGRAPFIHAWLEENRPELLEATYFCTARIDSPKSYGIGDWPDARTLTKPVALFEAFLLHVQRRTT